MANAPGVTPDDIRRAGDVLTTLAQKIGELTEERDNLTAEVRRTRAAAVKLRKERDSARAEVVALREGGA